MATADIDLDFREHVVSKIRDESDGLTREQLRMSVPARYRADLEFSVCELIRRGIVVEVTRTHGTDEEHKDHARLMVLRQARGVR